VLGRAGVILRKVRAGVIDEPTGFVWVEDKKVAASGLPASRSQVEWLSKQGVQCILTLTERPLPPEFLKGLDLSNQHIPMVDHSIPSPEVLDRGATYLIGRVAEGRSVVVHCLAGQGRTGCVLAAYVMKSRHVGAAEAIEIIRKEKPGFVELAQERALFDYERILNP